MFKKYLKNRREAKHVKKNQEATLAGTGHLVLLKTSYEIRLATLKYINYMFLVLFLMMIYLLHKSVTTREYIFAGTLTHFQKIRPNEVPKEYVDSAIKNYVRTYSNIDYDSVESRYKYLMRHMHSEFKERFFLATRDKIDKIRLERVVESSVIKQYKLKTDDQGRFVAHVLIHKKIYNGSTYIGSEADVIEISMKLVEPTMDLKWFLSITDFKVSNINDYKKRCKECLIN